MHSKPSYQELRENLYYNPETGDFFWLVFKPGRRADLGIPAGCINHKGYQLIGWNYEVYFAHRLAWFYMTGKWPQDQIDHINCIKNDNRWANLREATNSLNHQNIRSPNMDNKLGVLGVLKVGKKFRTRIGLKNGATKHLGYYNSPELAHSAYVEAKRILHAGNTL